jgi:single-strand DNA-binding protein
MATVNKVLLIGNLTRDPELKYTPGGAAVAEFGLALNESYKNKQTGQMTEKVHYIDIVCWARTAEIASEYLKKGSPVHIEGKLTQDRWQDQASGQNRSKIRVTCERLTFLGGKQNGAGGGGGQGAPAEGAPVGDESDIPF